MELELVHPEAKLPLRATRDSVGYDLSSVESKTIPPLSCASFDTGLRITNMNKHIFAQLMSRSGLVKTHSCITCAGTIDPDYRGKISVVLANLSANEPTTIKANERISQLVFMPAIHPVSSSLQTRDDIRGEGKFGSTGK